MADASKYEENVKKYAKGYNQAAAEKIVGHLGIALRNRDSSLVSCSDDTELGRVREKWCRGKLALAHSNDELDAAIGSVCDSLSRVGWTTPTESRSLRSHLLDGSCSICKPPACH